MNTQTESNEELLAEQARQERIANHWLLKPLRPFHSFGAFGLWLGFMVLFFLLRYLNMRPLAGLLALAYLILVIYSWVVPWLLRKIL